MVKYYTAFTNEIDDVELAVTEIMEQLDIENNLLENSVGIITCLADYIETGVVKELCARLPFDVAGSTTLVSATQEELGETMLGIMVITSDDVVFSSAITEPLKGEDEAAVAKAYKEAETKLPGKPVFMLSFAPLLFNAGTDFFATAADKVSGGVPNFGTVVVGHDDNYANSQVIYNGEGKKDQYAFILAHGNIEPKFYVGNISDEKVFLEKGVVTKSCGNQVQQINDMPVFDYLVTLGLEADEDGNLPGINSFPIMLDFNDGTPPVARAMFALTENGSVVCGGSMPEGSAFSIAAFDAEEINKTSTMVMESAVAGKNSGALIVFSCVGRYFSQGLDNMGEVELVKNIVQKAGLPCLFAYSGGEICPVYDKDGQISNRDHNNTIIICSI